MLIILLGWLFFWLNAWAVMVALAYRTYQISYGAKTIHAYENTWNATTHHPVVNATINHTLYSQQYLKRHYMLAR